MTYVESPRFGIGPNRNIVLDHAYRGNFDFFTMLDDDTTVHPKWFEWAVATLMQHDSVWSVSGIVGRAFAPSLPRQTHQLASGLAFLTRKIPATNNFVARTEPFRRVNLRFDERLPYAGGTDTRFFSAAAHHGAQFLLFPEITVVEHDTVADHRPAMLALRAYGRGESLGAWLALDYPLLRQRMGMAFRKLLRANASTAYRMVRGGNDHGRLSELIQGMAFSTGLLVGVVSGTASPYKVERRTRS